MSEAGPSTPAQFPLRAIPRTAPATITTPIPPRAFTPFKPSIVSSLRKEVKAGEGFDVSSKPKKTKGAKKAAAAVSAATSVDGDDTEEKVKDGSGLLLPEHVSILDDAPGEALAPEDEIHLEAQDYEGIQFLDDDISKGTSRYFAPVDDDTESRKVCRTCKQPGHIAKDCTKVICLTCGAEDEHESRDCPIALVCFGCGGRGHRKMDCPDSRFRYAHRQVCNRCGSGEHQAMNCPTLWRIYVYLSKDGHKDAMDVADHAAGWTKEAVANSKTSQDEWCYNCARRGHFGDNCPERRESFKKLVEPSAFSDHFALHGPFSHSDSRYRSSRHQNRERERSRSPPRHSRDFDYDQSPQTDLPYVAPRFAGSNAGQRGKDKHRQQMRELELRYDTEGTDGEGNWFAGQEQGQGPQRGPNRKNGKGRQPSPPRLPQSLPPHKPAFRFGQMSAPGSEASPSAGRKKAGGSLLRQATQSTSSRPPPSSGTMLRENSATRSQHRDPPPHREERDDYSSRSAKRRNRSNPMETQGERDYEAEWRREGRGGGNVQSWGYEYDRDDLERRRADERARNMYQQPQQPPRGGRKYHGGY